MLRLTPIALLLLAACNRTEPAATPANEVASAEQEAPAPEVPLLEGGWALTKVDGRDAGGLTASFKGGQASISSGCIRRAWTYTQKRNMVSFSPSPSGSSNCGGGTPGGTAETAYAALTEANIAIFSQGGKRADLSGTGGNLTLERR